jgi:hypothetical protein
MTKEYHVFVGYDDREKEFYDLCEYSIQLNSKAKVHVHPVKHQELRNLGLLTRSWTIEANGQFIDNSDKKPFSTQFSHSRFLVPSLAKRKGIKGHVMFVDCDFLFLDDITKAFKEAEESKGLPVYVVKHNYSPKNKVKMDNKQQVSYGKKLWSSCMIFDVDHPENFGLNPIAVNNADGNYLHTFQWLSSESMIGSLNERWNFIPDHSEERVAREAIGAIHYTEGGPCLPGYENCKYSEVYYNMKDEYIYDTYVSKYMKPLVLNH